MKISLTYINLKNFSRKKYGWNLVMRIFFLPYNYAKIIFNVHTLKDIKNKGYQLGSAYEQEFEKKLRTAIDFNSKIIDFNEKL